MNRIKKISIWVVIFILIAFVIHYVYNKKHNPEKFESQLVCFQNTTEDKIRDIHLEVISSKSIDEKVVKGIDIYKENGSIVENYKFAGIFKGDNIIDVVGDISGEMYERVYEIDETGITEGVVKPNSMVLVDVDKKKLHKINSKSEIIFDKKLLVKKIECK